MLALASTDRGNQTVVCVHVPCNDQCNIGHETLVRTGNRMGGTPPLQLSVIIIRRKGQEE